MGLLNADEAMTLERAERVQLANAIDERSKNPLNVTRKGGYFHSSAGWPVDCDSKPIPEGEWKPEDLARLKPQAVAAADGAAPVVKDGADVVEPSGSEKRQQRPGPRARM